MLAWAVGAPGPMATHPLVRVERDVPDPGPGEILVRVASGMAGKEIAGDLGIALKTVEFHKARISQQLGLRSRAAMTRYALEHGLAPLRKRD